MPIMKNDMRSTKNTLNISISFLILPQTARRSSDGNIWYTGRGGGGGGALNQVFFIIKWKSLTATYSFTGRQTPAYKTKAGGQSQAIPLQPSNPIPIPN